MNTIKNINEVNINYTVTPLGVIFINTVYIEPKLRGQGRFKQVLIDLQKIYKAPIELEAFHTLVPMYEHLGFKDMNETDDQGYHLMRRDFIPN